MSASPDPADTVPDAELVARVVGQDDRAAFEALVLRHQGAIRSLLRRLTRGDAALADDLAQECFLQAYRALAGFRGDARLRTWLYRIACNVHLQHCRGAQAAADRARPAIPADDDAAVPEIASPVASAALDWAIDLRRALDGLSEAELAAIVYCYYADLTHTQAAAALGCPVGTLKTHVLRARHKLEIALAAWRGADALETMP